MTVIETSGSRKSPDAFRTISEVAVDLDVPQHVLRFWESKFAQIKPLKRGGGRRYYRPEDVDLLRGVRALLYKDGYTIKGVQKVFRDQGVRFVIETGRAAGEESVAGLALASVQRASEGAAGGVGGASGLGSDARAVLGGIAKRLADLQAELDKSVAKDSADL
ncbi:MAG: MerR family transcriptional regulator [Rhodobiaceae bacterium]|nr:MAG: MerR family transcriptional regulator [Rhodobiaceae bacterium]